MYQTGIYYQRNDGAVCSLSAIPKCGWGC